MARFLFLAFLASILSAPANAQEAADKSIADHLKAHLKALETRRDIARVFAAHRTPTDPTGEFVYIDARVDLERATDAFPPEGIIGEVIGFGGPPCYPTYRLRVPAGRVAEVEELLVKLRPPPGAKF